jgi:DNA-nicking Smr family endonuclease
MSKKKDKKSSDELSSMKGASDPMASEMSVFQEYLESEAFSQRIDEDALFQETMSEPMLKIRKQEGQQQPPKAKKHRKYLVESGEAKAERILDLHRMTLHQAIDSLRSFLQRAQRDKLKLVYVILGKGIHSAEKAVLKEEIPRWIKGEGRDFVNEFYPAPASMGSDGVLFIYIKPGKD